MQQLLSLLPDDILRRYEIFNYNHAAEILTQSFPDELEEIFGALRTLTITKEDIVSPGGNESPIPPKISAVLEPLGWREIKISGDLMVKFYPRAEKGAVFRHAKSGKDY